MKTTKIFIMALFMALSSCFVSFAAGMGPVKYTDKEQVFCYYNDDESFAKNEWKEVWNNWYYFDSEGVTKQNTWAEIDGKWYYFDQYSIMQHDTTIDGHTVGSDGAWIPADGETAPVQETEAGN